MPSKMPGRVGVGEKIGYGAGDLAISLYLNFFSLYLLYFFVDVGGLAPVAVGTMMLVVKLFDAVSDPVMGVIADRTRSRWGRYRGYLLWGAIPFSLSGAATFAAPDMSEQATLVWAYVAYGFAMVTLTLVGVPYSALLAAISPSAAERASTAAYRMVFQSLGGILVGVVGTTLVRQLGQGDEGLGIMLTMFCIAGVAIVSILTAFGATKERVPPSDQKNDIRGDLVTLIRTASWIAISAAAVTAPLAIASRASSAIFFFKYVVQDSGEPVFLFLNRLGLFFTALALGQVIGIVAANLATRRFDKRTLVIVAGAIKGSALVLFYFLPLDAVWLQTFVQLLIGIGFGMLMILAYAMFTDVAEYVEWKSGRQMTALVVSASIFALKTGIAIGAATPGIVMAATGFVANVDQAPQALFGINFAFTILPALMLIPGVGAIYFYRIDRKLLARLETELELRRAKA